jgi:hypothetical protein
MRISMHDSAFIESNWCLLAPVICFLYPLLSLAASDDSVGGLVPHSMHLLGTGLACNLTGLTGVQRSLVVSLMELIAPPTPNHLQRNVPTTSTA